MLLPMICGIRDPLTGLEVPRFPVVPWGDRNLAAAYLARCVSRAGLPIQVGHSPALRYLYVSTRGGGARPRPRATA